MGAVEELEAALRARLDRRASVRAAALDLPVPPLLPEEAPYAEPAVERRRRELAVGRHVARELLADRGVPPGPLLRREDRTVIWPDGFIGSITHTKDVLAVAVAAQGALPWLGLDVERSRVSTSLVSRLLREEEQVALQGLDEEQVRHHATVVFSAKEAFYKAQYPHTETYLGFQDVVLDLDLAAQTARARVVRPECEIQGLELSGFWITSGPWIASGFTRGP